MSACFDQSQDPTGRATHEVCSLYRAPDYVKAASAAELNGAADTPDRLFADQAGRRYPHHTKAACWLSAAFLVARGGGLPEGRRAALGERLRKAAAFHGLAAEFDRLEKRAAELAADPLAALPDSDFAWVAGPTRRLPLRNTLEVKQAAAWLVQYRDRFRFADRRDIATRVAEKAAALGADLGEHGDAVDRMAAFGGCAPSQAAALVAGRARAVRAADARMAGELEKFAGMIKARPDHARHHSALLKVAELVDGVDRAYGLAAHYSDRLPRPEDVLFTLNEKAARAMYDAIVGLTSGSVYEKDDLTRIPTRDIRDRFGDDIADATTADGVRSDRDKLAEVAATLPRGDAEAFDRLCGELGVRPMAKEAGTGSVGLTDSDLRLLAAAFATAG